MKKMSADEINSIIDDLVDHEYEHACKTHPHFADSLDRAFVILGEEVGEVAKAIYEKNHTEMVMELAQVMAVCRRFIGFAMEKDACSHKPGTCDFFDDGLWMGV